MTTGEKLAALRPGLGRVCVYIEDGVFSVARVAHVDATEEGMRATMEAVPGETLVCHYREDPPRFAEEAHPVGDRWEIAARWEWFTSGEDVWDGSPYMGFRILFAPAVVGRYLARDLAWVEDYF